MALHSGQRRVGMTTKSMVRRAMKQRGQEKRKQKGSIFERHCGHPLKVFTSHGQHAVHLPMERYFLMSVTRAMKWRSPQNVMYSGSRGRTKTKKHPAGRSTESRTRRAVASRDIVSPNRLDAKRTGEDSNTMKRRNRSRYTISTIILKGDHRQIGRY